MSRLFTFNFRKSMIVAVLMLLLAHAVLRILDLKSPVFFANYWVIEHKYVGIKQFAKHGDIDIVVIGDSHADTGVDASDLEKITGLRTYNFSIPASSLKLQSLMVRDFIAPEIKPRVILWHIPERISNDYYQNFLDAPVCKLQQLPMGSRIIGTAKYLFPFQRRLPEEWIETVVNPPRIQKTYDDHGFKSLTRRYSDVKEGKSVRQQQARGETSTEPDWRFPIPRRFTIVSAGEARRNIPKNDVDDDTLQLVRRVIELTRRNGIEVIGFTAPANRDAFRPGEVMSIRGDEDPIIQDSKSLQSLIDEYEIPYANYRYYPPLSDDDQVFWDDDHLNHDGAEKLTRLLAHHLILKDKPAPPELGKTITTGESKLRQELSE